MFDILVFLFENYFEANLQPDFPTLADELSAAGFEQEEINQAFDWLSALDNLVEAVYPENFADSRSIRFYSDVEVKKINVESRGFLAFLEGSSVINPIQRELVIDRALALGESEVSLDQIKWIVLMVLWKQGHVDEYLFLEDLLLDEGEIQLH
ncbi:MAG: Smg family protein [Burkholderiales bacterium]|nr:DUF494 domain-containing protein [Sulfuricellaceae bacterium]